jgi:lipoate-protein ligase A
MEKMKLLATDWKVPYWNMALESHLMAGNEEGGFLFFYIHQPSVIVGSHQNTLEEINFPYVMEKGITVARRMSGGGAVYHDYGNLNFSFVADRAGERGIDFAPYTKPVIGALEKLGVKAELSGRNDILVGGKKVSGNAQFVGKKKVLSHGTLMFDVNIEEMVQSLSVDGQKIKSKAIQSIRSRVANLREHIKADMDIFEFREYLAKAILGAGMEEAELSDGDLSSIEEAVKGKFSTWEHNYGNSPPFSMTKRRRFDAGTVEIGLDVEGGKVMRCRITGDFFAARPVQDLERALVGMPLKREEIASLAEAEGAIASFSAEDLADLIFG